MLSACRKQELEEHQRRGWDGGIRTHDIRVKVWCVTITLHPNIGAKSTGIGITPNPRFRGVGKGVRTLDTRNHNPVLSRLSYTHHRSEMVRQEGFEPPAYCLEGSCSIQLSYCRILNLKICFSLKSASLLYISKLHLSTLFLIFYNYFPVLI